ncbi:Heparanase-like protein 1 [Vitis vinifera]|uniref:Heparanase-like protein 1 n=1 Tax=Vitis vinifera TaxID=29760 RepID=A0A438HFU8_VITVI|nr:Heparanase-like protein 1 [Vitis vinifera]
MGFRFFLFLFLATLPAFLAQEFEDAIIKVDGATTVAETDANFICATLDWWPHDKCNYNHCPWGYSSVINMDLSHPLFAKAIEAFKHLRIRIGGSLQDQVLYDIGSLRSPCHPFRKMNDGLFGFSKGCLRMSRWDELNRLFSQTGVILTFGLNALYGRYQIRKGAWAGVWDSSNTQNFIKYTISKGYQIDSWEFGNELSGSGVGASVNAEQYGKDLINLKAIINKLYNNSNVKPLLVAPGGFYEQDWYAKLLQVSGSSTVNVVTHHIYNLGAGEMCGLERIRSWGSFQFFVGMQLMRRRLGWVGWGGWGGVTGCQLSILEGGGKGGRMKPGILGPLLRWLFSYGWVWAFIGSPETVKLMIASVDPNLVSKILNPHYLSRVEETFKSLDKTLQTWALGLLLGLENLVGLITVVVIWCLTPLYLDQLGMASKYHTKVYCRQTLIGGNYGLYNPKIWYLILNSALLWHRLMGKGVLAVDSTASPFLRSYAHCSKGKAGITLLLINLSNQTTFQINVENSMNLNLFVKKTTMYRGSAFMRGLKKSASWIGSKADEQLFREEYHLTPKDGYLRSQTMVLNGMPLELTDDGNIPSLNPVRLNLNAPIFINPLSIAFIAFPNFDAPACA